MERYYRDLEVALNDEGREELCFRSEEIAGEFAMKALECGKVYVCDADRYSMQYLSEIVRSAMARRLFDESLLYTTEKQVIAALNSDPEGMAGWDCFCRLRSVRKVGDGAEGNGTYPVRKISAKKRYIDPYVAGKGRVSELNRIFREEVEAFLTYSFDYYLEGCDTENI